MFSLEEKAEPPQAMNALMRLNQLKPGLQYKLVSQTGPVHAPIFTMSVEVDGNSFEASGPSKKTAKLHVAVKVSTAAASYDSKPLPSSCAPSEPSSHLSTRLKEGMCILKWLDFRMVAKSHVARTPSSLWLMGRGPPSVAGHRGGLGSYRKAPPVGWTPP